MPKGEPACEVYELQFPLKINFKKIYINKYKVIKNENLRLGDSLVGKLLAHKHESLS